jgi:hypothetical protein
MDGKRVLSLTLSDTTHIQSAVKLGKWLPGNGKEWHSLGDIANLLSLTSVDEYGYKCTTPAKSGNSFFFCESVSNNPLV